MLVKNSWYSPTAMTNSTVPIRNRSTTSMTVRRSAPLVADAAVADGIDHEHDDLHGPVEHHQGRRQQGRRHGEVEQITGMAQVAEQPMGPTGGSRAVFVGRRCRVLRPRHATLLAALLDGGRANAWEPQGTCWTGHPGPPPPPPAAPR